MSEPIHANRRGFLRQLAGLPLVGGGLSLLGQPQGISEPVTRELLESYNRFLVAEHSKVWLALNPDRAESLGVHEPRDPLLSSRAAVVMRALTGGAYV